MMPSGEPSLAGGSIILAGVTTRDSGVYTCTATIDDNTVSNNIIVNIDAKETVAARELKEETKSSVNSLSSQYYMIVITILYILCC